MAKLSLSLLLWMLLRRKTKTSEEQEKIKPDESRKAAKVYCEQYIQIATIISHNMVSNSEINTNTTAKE